MRWVLAMFMVGSSPAQAWEHMGAAWDATTDFPISYRTTDDGAADCLAGIEAGACATATATAYQTWTDLACTEFSGSDDGLAVVTTASGLDLEDALNTVAFGHDIEPGVLGWTLVQRDGIAFSRGDVVYEQAVQADVALSANVPWARHDEVLSGQCEDGYDLQAVLTHELGHVAGLGHSCEYFDACTDPLLRDAAMYYMTTECNPTQAEPNSDDAAGLQNLYGPWVSVACGTSGSLVQTGIAPLTLNCAMSSTGSVDSVIWRFGDGGTAEGTAVTYTWETEGLYTVAVEVEGTDPRCGAWSSVQEMYGYVRACEPPEAAFHLEHRVGKTYEVLNDTAVSVLGCATEVQWAIYEGDAVAGTPYEVRDNWEFRYEFPDEGSWTLVLNVAGPAGTTAAALTVDVERHSGLSPLGCAHPGPVGGASAWGLLGLLLLRRRGRG